MLSPSVFLPQLAIAIFYGHRSAAFLINRMVRSHFALDRNDLRSMNKEGSLLTTLELHEIASSEQLEITPAEQINNFSLS